MATHFSAAERRLLDHTLRTINDQPRKKKRRQEELHDFRFEEANPLVLRLPPTTVITPDTFLVRIFSNWIRDPLCRRIASSEYSPPSPTSSIEKRFPKAKDEDFVRFESLKSFVGEKSPTNQSKLLLVDGDRVEIVNKSIGDAFEIRVKKKKLKDNYEWREDEAREIVKERSVRDESALEFLEDGSHSTTSFELLSESFAESCRDEEIYPPFHSALNPFELRIPPFSPPSTQISTCANDDENENASVCFSRQVTDAFTCEWRSDSTSQVELSFRTDSLIGCDTRSFIDAAPPKDVDDDTTNLMVERFKRRLEASRRLRRPFNNEGAATLRGERNPFCAIPVEVLGRGIGGKAEENILRLAYVEELIEDKKGRAWLLNQEETSSSHNPFLCEGKIVRLSIDPSSKETMGKSNFSSSDTSDFLVTPRFDFTLEEYLQQTNESSVEGRLLLFLQSLEAVAHLHGQNLAHGSVSASNYFVDVKPDGDHRLLLSNFSKTRELSEENRKSDSWQLGLLGLRLFDNDVDGNVVRPRDESGCESSSTAREDDFCVDDLPVLDRDAPLEMDILVHLLLSKDPSKRVTPSVAANMLHLYFWRRDLLSNVLNDAASAISCTTSNSPSSAISSSFAPSSSPPFTSLEYEAAKNKMLKSFESRKTSNVDDSLYEGSSNQVDDNVKLDLKQCLFRRARFEDVLHADEMWKKTKGDLAKFAATKDEAHLQLFIDVAE